MLNALTNIMPTLSPEHIMMDFEMAAIKSFKKTFPSANIHGCYFHLCQNIMKHVKSNGLESDYENDQNFSTVIRMLMALAFVPNDKVKKMCSPILSAIFNISHF